MFLVHLLAMPHFLYSSFGHVATTAISSTGKLSTTIPLYIPKYDYQKNSTIAVNFITKETFWSLAKYVFPFALHSVLHALYSNNHADMILLHSEV